MALRVGDHWLRLVRARATVGTSLTRSDGTVLDPSLLRASAGEGRVGVYVENAQLEVEPGSSTTTSVTLLNQGSVVDHFKVTLDGIPADWTPSPPPVTQLMPGEQKQVSLTIQPPRAPQSRAGRYPVSVRVKSQDAPDQVAEMKIILTVAAYSQFTSQLQPQKVRAGKSASLTVKNQGNSQETFNLSWKDRADELAFDPPQARLRVPEGGTASAEFRAAPRRRRWIGGGQSHPITAQVSSAAGVTQTHSGEVVSRALFPVWVLPLLIFLCVLFTGAAWLFYRNQVEQVNSATQAAIAERTAIVQVVEATHQAATEAADFLKNANQATLQAATETAAWMEEDDDRDGLTNRQELDLGTLPDARDTDEDGLDDSEELIRGTDPLKADTDGDGLKDGDEVSQGIDPLNTDTDGDGIPDNEDEFPGKVPTDTPTLTPTHTSTTTTTPTPSASPTSTDTPTDTPTPTPAPSGVTIEFDKFPNGSSINTSLILSGNEFSEKGIHLAGAPETSYCGDATAAAIRVSSYGYSYNFLTSARPGNINACNTVLVEIRFTNTVRSVTLTFAGASSTYTLKAYDSDDNLLGTADKDAVSGGGLFEVTFNNTANKIHRITFGSQASLTVIKKVSYNRLIIAIIPMPIITLISP